MAEFKFVGNPADADPKSPVRDARSDITAFGIEFPKGRFIKVEDERIAAKLRANSHFAEKAG